MKKKGIFPLCIGLALLAVFLLAAIAPGLLTPYGPKELFARWLPSGGAHLLGTNAMGYDIFTELVYGARQTLLAGVLSSILALALGALIGILSTTFIEACRIQGYSRAHIALRHILPNLSDVLLSRFLLSINSCIMMESTLSFLGLGDLYRPTWGTMVSFAYKRGAFLRGAYAYLLAPGVCIMLLSLAFYAISLYFEAKKSAISEV